MRQRLKTALSPLFCAACLTACTSAPPQLVRMPVTLDIPGHMFHCQDGPYDPGPDATQRDVALMILDYEEALAACKAKLKAVQDIVAGQVK